MPLRSLVGCFNLPHRRKEYPAKNDVLVLSSDEECPGENDFLDLSSEEECPRENDLLDLTSEDLSRFTDHFSLENLIGVTQFAKLYRGKMPMGLNQENEVIKDVTVKILDDDLHKKYDEAKQRFYEINNKLPRLEAELKFLQSPRIWGNPNLVKVIGCCRKDETLGVVYDLNSHSNLSNLIIRDDFKWLQRVKTALALSRLLNYLHARKSPYLIRNLHPDHIVVDQNFTPILIEFGMLVGGIVGNPIDESGGFLKIGRIGYTDPSIALFGPAAWTAKSDVYAFGVLLLNLITKSLIDEKTLETGFHVTRWALKEYTPGCSFVHRSLEDDPCFDPCDGPNITKLAIQCLARKQENRPEMKKVIKRLKALHVVQQHGGCAGCGEQISSFYRN